MAVNVRYIALVCIQGIIYIEGRVQSCQQRSCQVTISYCHLVLLRPKVQPLVIDTWTNRGPMAGNKSRVARPFD